MASIKKSLKDSSETKRDFTLVMNNGAEDYNVSFTAIYTNSAWTCTVTSKGILEEDLFEIHKTIKGLNTP
jgi:hypothetical protein